MLKKAEEEVEKTIEVIPRDSLLVFYISHFHVS